MDKKGAFNRLVSLFMAAAVAGTFGTAVIMNTGCTSSQKNSQESSKTESSKTESSKTESSKTESSVNSAEESKESSAEVLAEKELISFKKPDFWGDKVEVIVTDFSMWESPDEERDNFYARREMTDNGNGVYTYDISELKDHPDYLYTYFMDEENHYYSDDKPVKFESAIVVEPANEKKEKYTFVDEIVFEKSYFWSDDITVFVGYKNVFGNQSEPFKLTERDDGLFYVKTGKDYEKPDLYFIDNSNDFSFSCDYEKDKVFGGKELVKGKLTFDNEFDAYEDMPFFPEDIDAVAECGKKVTYVSLTGAEIKEGTLAAMSKLKELYTLQINSSKGIDDLSELRSDSLSTLIFTWCDLKEENLRTLDLSKLPELTCLIIRRQDEIDTKWLEDKGIEVLMNDI